MKVVILKDGAGNPQGVIRQLPGDQERLYDPSGKSIATYSGRTNFTYDNNGPRWQREPDCGLGGRLRLIFFPRGVIAPQSIPPRWFQLQHRRRH